MDSVLVTELINSAATFVRPHRVGDRLVGDVAATLVTTSGQRFSGVCIDTGSGTGFCAEHAAIAAMVTAGQYRIAVLRDLLPSHDWPEPEPRETSCK